MPEVRDPAIKLFGKTIQLPPDDNFSSSAATATIDAPPAAAAEYDYDYDHNHHEQNPSTPQPNKKSTEEELTENNCQNSCSSRSSTAEDPAASSAAVREDPTTLSDEEKTLKKPDKILPCPRCNSMDTKFCYFNNYNVNQPRHFCKGCQRYWTAGGSMRNVPVGSGRRKNKSLSASYYRHVMVSEALQQAAQAESAKEMHNPTLKPNGNLLNFGSDAPLCESMASVLSLVEKSQNCPRNGEDRSSGSSTSSSSAGLQIQCIAPPTWTAFGPPPGFPVTFYPGPVPVPATYWGVGVPSPYNMPWPYSPTSAPTSPTLGKHSRDGNLLNPSNSDKEDNTSGENHSTVGGGVWIPKTLRIDDLSEAAQSSIWSTLGIKNENVLFNNMQSKGNEENHVPKTSQVLQANPAALSRSQNFNERS